MKQLELLLKTFKSNHNINDLRRVMPIIHKPELDNTIRVELPLLNITTTAFSEDDVELAVIESVQLFIKSAEKFGKGLENELKLLMVNY